MVLALDNDGVSERTWKEGAEILKKLRARFADDAHDVLFEIDKCIRELNPDFAVYTSIAGSSVREFRLMSYEDARIQAEDLYGLIPKSPI